RCARSAEEVHRPTADAAGSLQCRAGNRAAGPLPPPLFLLTASCLWFAPDALQSVRFLDQAEPFLHNQKASVATLRLLFGTGRNPVRLHPGMLFAFAGMRKYGSRCGFRRRCRKQCNTESVLQTVRPEAGAAGQRTA